MVGACAQNLYHVINPRSGVLPNNKIHWLAVDEALVDVGVIRLSMPPVLDAAQQDDGQG